MGDCKENGTPTLDFETREGRALARLKTAVAAVYGLFKGGATTEEEEAVYWSLTEAVDELESVIVPRQKAEAEPEPKEKKGPTTGEGKPTPE